MRTQFNPNSKYIYITEGNENTLAGSKHGLNVLGICGRWADAFEHNEEKTLINELRSIDWQDKNA